MHLAFPLSSVSHNPLGIGVEYRDARYHRITPYPVARHQLVTLFDEGLVRDRTYQTPLPDLIRNVHRIDQRQLSREL